MTVDPDSLFIGMKEKRGHKSAEHEMPQSDGSSFVIKIRISIENPFDFSVILGYTPPKATKAFHLRRYNGRSHEHKNRIEKRMYFMTTISIRQPRGISLKDRKKNILQK